MQFTKDFKQRIAKGEINVSLRTWKKPQARVGGHYNIPPFGAIEVTDISQLALRDVAEPDIAACGFSDLETLQTRLAVAPSTLVYRVAFRYLGSTPVKVPDVSEMSAADCQSLLARLVRMDAKSAWTQQTLHLIAAHPGTRAGDLAPQTGQALPEFKRNVRKLKGLGLTQSLETGYRITARGTQVLKALQ